MNGPRQHGNTLPEMLVTLAGVALVITTLSSSGLQRFAAVDPLILESEARNLADLVGRAHRLGRLQAGDSTAADLARALPEYDVPTTVGQQQPYTFTISGDDPRVQVENQVVRPRLSARALRVPIWRTSVNSEP